MRLSDFSEISAGYPFRGKIKEIPRSGNHVVQMKDCGATTGIDWESVMETEITGKRKPDWLRPGDILFASRGSQNYSVLVDTNANTLKAIAAPHFFVIRCNTEQLLPSFLTWQLNQQPAQAYLKKEAGGSSTKTIRKDSLGNTPIVIPDLKTQNQIVRVYDTIKQERQLLNQLIHNGETLMKAIVTDLFAQAQQE
ncbi:MAG: restriction endonuclease subunit S [Pseudomonadales bacterium]|nr:restriction endonuclease subunit S [Pseudomonadales bacterium]